MKSMQLPLHDIVEASEVSWWPLAWGWWALILLFLSTIIFIAYYWTKRYLRLRAKRAALVQINHSGNSLSELNLLTKRAALAYFPRQQIAPLQGRAWFEFMVQQMPAKRQAAFSAQLEGWQDALYRPQQNQEIEAYRSIMKEWVRYALPPGHPKEAKGV
ncbi:DUF4381 domain-containing protein [Aliidiomarina minuta]|uniref:DUF4381 domain-containing protein n=1 Tax=Aliidiomarina minuta TaxID=880057 RepID=A0A432W5A1_9GAMM|nr:DUF4381 domain-containing protein [Aliidiomarina minuta]RUO25237.1 DUF4381 domain-containing protein [Aliidiomarina minuta]